MSIFYFKFSIPLLFRYDKKISEKDNSHKLWDMTYKIDIAYDIIDFR